MGLKMARLTASSECLLFVVLFAAFSGPLQGTLVRVSLFERKLGVCMYYTGVRTMGEERHDMYFKY